MMTRLASNLFYKTIKFDLVSRLYSVTVLLLLVLLMPGLAMSQQIEQSSPQAIPVAEDPEVEKRMIALTEDLRCLVCQNESIAESRADFSNDMRREIREQIQANKTDAEIIEFLVDRYGDFVLYNPPMKPTTVLLWFGPLILFVFGVWFLISYIKKRRIQIEEVTLSEAQRKKVEAMLNEENK